MPQSKWTWAAILVSAIMGFAIIAAVGGEESKDADGVTPVSNPLDDPPQSAASPRSAPTVSTKRSRVIRSGSRHVVVLKTKGAGSVRFATAGYGRSKARAQVVLRVRPKVAQKLREQPSLRVSGFTERRGAPSRPFRVTLLAPKPLPPPVVQAPPPPVVAPPEPESDVQPLVEAPNCDPNYSPCVPVVAYDLNCADIGHGVSVVGADPHGFDRDRDGRGCESY